MIAIVDYGRAICIRLKRVDYLGAEAVVTDQPGTVAAARKDRVAGVGNFSSCKL